MRRLKGHKAKAWKRWKAETKYSAEWIPPGEIGINGNIMPIRTLRKQGRRMRTGVIWLRTRNNVGFL
jgi:hypothetical protein